jgi:hypothetical protein
MMSIFLLLTFHNNNLLLICQQFSIIFFFLILILGPEKPMHGHGDKRDLVVRYLRERKRPQSLIQVVSLQNTRVRKSKGKSGEIGWSSSLSVSQKMMIHPASMIALTAKANH